MPYERIPNQAEIYMSFMIATDDERARGILLSKETRQTRFNGCEIPIIPIDETSFTAYERKVLDAVRIRFC